MAASVASPADRGSSITEIGNEINRGVYDESDMYTIVLKKGTEPGSLPVFGLGYRATSETTLFVTGILPETPMETWNDKCKINDTVCIADEICCVNGKCGAKDMVEELQCAPEVEVILARTGPRWHIKGVVAECIDEIDTAKERGIDLTMDENEEIFQTLRGTVVQQETFDATYSEVMIISLVAAAPTLVILIFFSHISPIGTGVYEAFASDSNNTFGNGLICLSCLIAITMYVLDIRMWKSGKHKAYVGCVMMSVHLLGWLFKSKFYPFVPLVYLNMLIPLQLGLLKNTALKKVHRKHFYQSAAVTFLFMGVLVLVVWILWMFAGDNQWSTENKLLYAERARPLYESQFITVDERKRYLDYMWDCHPTQHSDFEVLDVTLQTKVAIDYELDKFEKDTRKKKCAQVATIWFIVYMVPLISIIVNLVYAAFSYVNGVKIDMAKADKIEKALKQFMLTVLFMCFIVYVGVSIGGGTNVQLGTTIMSFAAAAIALLFMWMYDEIGQRAVTAAILQSKVMQMMINVGTSSIFRGLGVLIGAMAIPVAFLAVVLNQWARVMRGISRTKCGFSLMAILPDYAYKLVMHLRRWHWPGIMLWANIWSMAYFTLSVGVMRATYIFMAWLNNELEKWPLGLVLVAFFFIGFTMFLAPPVPGVPVYVAAGIIISYQTRSMPELGGFWGGIAIASVLVVGIKIAAVCGQYAIGYFMYNSIGVRAAVGVDQVAIRGVEKILKTRGLNLPKVSVLVGGPDWPTSVLCGLLRLNLPQIILGTLPVFIVSTPCVVAGAFLTGPGGEGSDTYRALSTTVMLLATMMQSCSFLLALYYIQDNVFRYNDELSIPRPEDEPVREKSAKQAELAAVYQEATAWAFLNKFEKVCILSSTWLLSASFYLFVLMDSSCWRPFSLSNKISDPYDEGGLNGDWISIILPLGGLALVMFFSGCVLDQIYRFMANRRCKELHAKLQIQAQKIASDYKHNRASRDSNSSIEGVPAASAIQGVVPTAESSPGKDRADMVV